MAPKFGKNILVGPETKNLVVKPIFDILPSRIPSFQLKFDKIKRNYGTKHAQVDLRSADVQMSVKIVRNQYMKYQYHLKTI
jgi:hypothetical protein